MAEGESIFVSASNVYVKFDEMVDIKSGIHYLYPMKVCGPQL